MSRASCRRWSVAVAAVALAGPTLSRGASAQSPPAPRDRREVAVELFGGAAWSLRTPLTVRQPATPPATLRARYTTRPLADAPYYAYRVSYGTAARAVEAELLHHKLYLENPRPPVERLEVTHGYNLVTANVRAPWRRYTVRTGLGVVVAHAEGRVAGQPVGARRTRLGGGYHVAGPTAQLAAGRRYLFGRGALAAFAAPELKLTASLARVPAGAGSVRIPNVAAHALVGLGLRRAGRAASRAPR